MSSVQFMFKSKGKKVKTVNKVKKVKEVNKAKRVQKSCPCIELLYLETSLDAMIFLYS